jgi:hypothetical protein
MKTNHGNYHDQARDALSGLTSGNPIMDMEDMVKQLTQERDELREVCKKSAGELGDIVGAIHYHDEAQNVLLTNSQWHSIEKVFCMVHDQTIR